MAQNKSIFGCPPGFALHSQTHSQPNESVCTRTLALSEIKLSASFREHFWRSRSSNNEIGRGTANNWNINLNSALHCCGILICFNFRWGSVLFDFFGIVVASSNSICTYYTLHSAASVWDTDRGMPAVRSLISFDNDSNYFAIIIAYGLPEILLLRLK